MEQYLWLISLGFVIGAFATLIGTGGGIILAPMLLLLYPNESTETLTSISLAVVFFNALSGSVAYARAKRVDYYSGAIFSVARIPGAILGALTTFLISRPLFDLLIGVSMLAASGFLFWRPSGETLGTAHNPARHFSRRVVEADGTEHKFSYNRAVGVALSLFVGYISSLLGIGGDSSMCPPWCIF